MYIYMHAQVPPVVAGTPLRVEGFPTLMLWRAEGGPSAAADGVVGAKTKETTQENSPVPAVHLLLYKFIHVCMYIYVCMYVCMYIYIYISIYIYIYRYIL